MTSRETLSGSIPAAAVECGGVVDPAIASRPDFPLLHTRRNDLHGPDEQTVASRVPASAGRRLQPQERRRPGRDPHARHRPLRHLPQHPHQRLPGHGLSGGAGQAEHLRRPGLPLRARHRGRGRSGGDRLSGQRGRSRLGAVRQEGDQVGDRHLGRLPRGRAQGRRARAAAEGHLRRVRHRHDRAELPGRDQHRPGGAAERLVRPQDAGGRANRLPQPVGRSARRCSTTPAKSRSASRSSSVSATRRA